MDMVNPWFQLLRPHQWLKNLILLFPLFLGGGLFSDLSWLDFVAPVLAFCLASSASYIVNDLHDREQDLNHPQKCHRPLAAGAISQLNAVFIALSLLILAGIIAWRQPPMFSVWLLAYLLLSLGYSFGLKDQPIVDVFCIASGFVFRLFAGGAAFGVSISDWLFLSVLLLAIYLSFGKRLSELRHEGGGSPEKIRPVLARYPGGFLEGGMYISGAAVLVTYTMYVLVHPLLVYTVPICCFGLFVYLLRVMSGHGGDPTHALLKDPLLFLVGLVWVVFVGWSIYGAR